MLLAGILAAVLSGVLMSIQGVCNTGVSKSAGTWTTAAFVSLTAGAVSLGIRLLAGKHESGFSALAQVQPRYLCFQQSCRLRELPYVRCHSG